MAAQILATEVLMKSKPCLLHANFMTRKIILLLVAAAGSFALTTNATIIRFQEFGDKGHSFTFSQNGYDLTLTAFFTSGADTNVYFNAGGGDDDGVGTTGDPSGENAIATTTFIQLTVPTNPASNFQNVSIGNIGSGESANVYFTTTAGSLVGATLLGTLTANGSVAVGPLFQNGFIDVTAGAGNVLLTSVEVSPVTSVPDVGFTASLLGMGLVGLAGLRRKLHA
jgi:hypothetical protein